MSKRILADSSLSIIGAFLEHRKILAAYLAQRLLQPQDVEDILQETFAAAYQHENKGKISSPKAYLFTIARNIMSKHLTEQSRKMACEVGGLDFDEMLADDATIEQELDVQIQLRYIIKKAMSELPSQCRRVFLLRKIYGWTHKKIAKKLGISISTVERHITIALTRLDASLQEDARNGNVSVLRNSSMEETLGRKA